MAIRFPARTRRTAGALLALVLPLSACDWPGRHGHWAEHDGDRRVAHTVTGDTGDRREATFELVNGADVVRVHAADLGDDRYRVSTPDDARVAPSVHVDDGTVLTGLAGTGEGGPAIVDVVLSDAVRWRVRLAGGANEQVVDLTAGRVDAVEFDAGSTRAEVSLPAASATTRVLMNGGVSQFLVHLTGDAPVRVRAGGGAGTVTVDGATRSGVAGGTLIAPADWATGTDRYDIDATAGVSALTVDRR